VTVGTDELRRVIRGLLPRARDFLAGAIAFPSTHGNEAGVQRFIEETWEAAGLRVERHPIPESIRDDPEYTSPAVDRPFAGRDNLVARMAGPAPGRSAVVNSHVDVVPADDWPDAYTPRVEGDVVFGRGACDAKGCVATMYLAACAMAELGLPRAGEVIFQIVVDEEVGGNGTLALVREGVRADGAVVCESTHLAVHPANRGAVWFRFDFQGRSCHMGSKHEGVSAIDLACETIGILYRYEAELIEDKKSQPLFAGYEFPAQVNVGMIGGGHFPSAVAGAAWLEGGIGFLPCRPMEQVKADVVRRIETLGSETLKARYRLSWPKLHNDSYETPPDDPLVRTFHEAATEAGAPAGLTGWNVSCDARLLAKLGGMPTVVFGPGGIEDAHSASERIALPEVEKAAEALVRFVDKWCVGPS
jgi:acetylornithine deacetylase